MTAQQVLTAKAGEKVGLGNGLRLICDKRNGGRACCGASYAYIRCCAVW